MVLVGGAGRHIYDITYEGLNRFIDLAAGETTLFYISVGLIKVSITLFNSRLTGLTSKPWMIYHTILLVLIVTFIITSIFIQVFKCLPVLHSWGFLGYGEPAQPVKCVTINTYSLALNVTHVILDFALLSVPIIVFCKMKMSKSKRIRLIFLFSIGAVSVIGSVNRQIIMQQNALDVTWESPQAEIWTTIDLFFGCIAASLPVLNALIPKRWRSPSVSIPTFVSEG
ncbi:hypothetical protein ABVK25_011796 [Lepraria finkii]|uniref:Rhodopsin domain-containing protein n=1 Tax=Lepraria finkii TaxID=1340010 RepID=A0ABR4AMS6_9LECA